MRPSNKAHRKMLELPAGEIVYNKAFKFTEML